MAHLILADLDNFKEKSAVLNHVVIMTASARYVNKLGKCLLLYIYTILPKKILKACN